jgi:recombination protein RecA
MARPKKSENVEEVKKDSPVATKVEGKNPKLQAMLAKISSKGNDMFGEGTIFRGADGPQMDVVGISTGSLSLDNAIGIGGLPKGRIIEISGPEASGKTIISLSTIAEVQRNGGIAAFIDAEHALTPDWCRSIGVDFDNLLLTQPDSGEKALSIMKFLVEEGKVDVIVLDSVAALVTQREIDGDMDANHMALTARLMSLALKKLTPIVSKSNTCCIFINQIRENVGQMFGNKETTPGGKALKFYSSVRLRANKTFKGEKFTGSGDNKTQIGHNVTVKVLKNKVAAPFRQATFDLYYNSGIDQNSEVKELALKKGIVAKAESGNKHTFGDREWASRKAFEEAMEKDPALVQELKVKVIEAMKSKAEDVVKESVVKEVNGMLVDTSTGEILDEAVDKEEDAD